MIDIQTIEQRIANARDWHGTPLGEAGDMSVRERTQMHAALGRTVRPAGVLVLLVEREGGLSVVLTQRTAHLHDHAGQISFPGGRMDEGDIDIVATALREANEEIGADATQIQVVGVLPNYITVTAYEVTPVVATSRPQAFAADPFEVADVFEVPLTHILDDANWRRDSFLRFGKRREYWAVPWQERYIWGATAGMLRTFRDVLLREAA